tara:strand:+ start:236 stop:673 length:438 start_codon:yes stop_codon:yes gene_type:complete
MYSKDHQFQIYSTALYLLAGLLGFYYKKNTIISTLTLLVAVASIFYHTDTNTTRQYKERLQFKSHYIDVFLSVTLFTYCAYVFLNQSKKQKNEHQLQRYLICITTIIMILFLGWPKKDKIMYDKLHPWAHIFGGISVLLLVLTIH